MSPLVVLERADALRVAALVAPALGTSWTERAVGEELARNGALALGIDVDGELVAALLGWVVAGELEINAVVVHPDARRAGLGRRLVDEAIRRAKTDGAVAAFLELRADNAPAMQLYSSSGFTVLDVRRRYYDDGTDAVVLRADLTEPT